MKNCIAFSVPLNVILIAIAMTHMIVDASPLTTGSNMTAPTTYAPVPYLPHDPNYLLEAALSTAQPNMWCYNSYQGTTTVVKEDGTVTAPWGDWILENDPSSYQGNFTFLGNMERKLWDMRPPVQLKTVWVWSFHVHFMNLETREAKTVEFLVNNEGVVAIQQALSIVRKYAKYLGQIPFFQLRNVDEIMINPGDASWAASRAGNGVGRHIIIHTEYRYQSPYEAEILTHEATHAGMDIDIYGVDMNWERAVMQDNKYISRYAQENPCREDAAETVSVWLATVYKKDTFRPDLFELSVNGVPNRIQYFQDKYGGTESDFWPLTDRTITIQIASLPTNPPPTTDSPTHRPTDVLPPHLSHPPTFQPTLRPHHVHPDEFQPTLQPHNVHPDDHNHEPRVTFAPTNHHHSHEPTYRPTYRPHSHEPTNTYFQINKRTKRSKKATKQN